MNKLPLFLRRFFCEPRADFSKNLRDSLLKNFSGNHTLLEGKLYFLAPKKPEENFKNDLRQKLLYEITPKKTRKRNIFSRKVFSSFQSISGLAVATFLLFSVAAIGLSPVGSASGKTFLTSFSGEVFVKNTTVNENNISLSPSHTITTEKNASAVITFFEDSLVRMDENTIVRIESLKPHRLRSDLGEVKISLLSGRIWVRNASSDERYSRFSVLTDNHTTVLDFGGAVEVSALKQEHMVRVWDRMARIFTDESEILLAQGEQFVSNFSVEKRDNILADLEKEDQWIAYNLQEDAVLSHTFVLQKIEQKNSENTSTLSAIKEVFLPNEDELVHETEDFFFDTLSLLAHGKSTDSAAFLKDFEEKVLALAEESPQKAEAFLASAEKSLSFVVPDSPFFAIREQVTDLRTQTAETLLALEKARTQKLWNARTLASAGHTVAAQNIVEESAGVPEGDVSAEVLEERELQIVALAQMEQGEELSAAAGDAQEDLVQSAKKALVRPGFPAPSQKDNQEKAQEVIRKIKKYESEIGQENTLLSHLDKIENNAENISLILEIKNRLPEDLQDNAQRKLLDILAAERGNK